MDNQDVNLGWALGGGFLTSKNAKHGEKVVICSEVREVDSKFNKDKNGRPTTDLLVDIQREDGQVNTLRLNKASQKALRNAGISRDNCLDVKCEVLLLNVLVRGELAQSIVLQPIVDK